MSPQSARFSNEALLGAQLMRKRLRPYFAYLARCRPGLEPDEIRSGTYLRLRRLQRQVNIDWTAPQDDLIKRTARRVAWKMYRPFRTFRRRVRPLSSKPKDQTESLLDQLIEAEDNSRLIEGNSRLREEIAALDPEDQVLFRLHLEKRNLRLVAEHMRISHDAARKRFARLRDKLSVLVRKGGRNDDSL